MSMNFRRKLPVPKEIKELYPLNDKIKNIKTERDAMIADVFTGKSDKFLLIIGPCSADNEDSVMDYTCRLSRLQEQVKDKIIIIPRIYTNKPRTTGEGYKGMIHQPDPTKGEDMLEGLIHVRKLHTRAIEETGLVCADEMLYPENYRYLSDILSYVAVGARSVEDQEHRLTASGMECPCGMKNPTSGTISIMLNSIRAAQSSHTFIYRGWEVNTDGNRLPTLSSEARRTSTTRLSRTTTTRISSCCTICTRKRTSGTWRALLTQITPTAARSTSSRQNCK